VVVGADGADDDFGVLVGYEAAGGGGAAGSLAFVAGGGEEGHWFSALFAEFGSVGGGEVCGGRRRRS